MFTEYDVGPQSGDLSAYTRHRPVTGSGLQRHTTSNANSVRSRYRYTVYIECQRISDVLVDKEVMGSVGVTLVEESNTSPTFIQLGL
jgi:hypothetical protein